MDFLPVYIANFLLLSMQMIQYTVMGAINALYLFLFENAFIYWRISIVGDTLYT